MIDTEQYKKPKSQVQRLKLGWQETQKHKRDLEENEMEYFMWKQVLLEIVKNELQENFLLWLCWIFNN